MAIMDEGVDGHASGLGMVDMRSSVAIDCGKMPFFTLLGYVEERLLDASVKGPPTFLLDNISIERMVPSPSAERNCDDVAHHASFIDDYEGSATTWLRFSLRPPTSPIECEGSSPVADICLSDQRVHENEYHMKLQVAKLADSRFHRTCLKVSWTKQNGAQVPGYTVGPVHAPAIIVIQEWWGINEQILAHAANIASQGYRVVVPDLYRGKVGVDAEEASHLMGNLDWSSALEDVASAAAYLKQQGSPTVGVMGFCMGGALSMAATIACDDIVCGVPFYGICDTSLADPAMLAKPMQAHFGELDTLEGFSNPAAVDSLEEKLQASGFTGFEILRYSGVGHAFMNDLDKDFDSLNGKHRQTTADSAWENVFSFLSSHLKK